VSDDYLNQKQAAERLGLGARQVANLRDDHGMPTVTRGGMVRYHWPTLLPWYVTFKIQDALKKAHKNRNGGDPEKQLRLRKLEIENEVAEIKLAKERSRYTTPEDLERVLEELLLPLRSRILQVPTKWAQRLKACRTVGQTNHLLQTLSRELLDELRHHDDSDPDPPKRTKKAAKRRKKRR
jgi:hypothetical protein